ncbi:hypothetical protein ACH4ZX_39775 [Streptomyces sp. NPDC020490]|uniref:hypothetical protein n=1 Tax=Streptomyces sp. NPDC020490 TaxID=3365078 RepID=UPI00379FD441
MPPRTYPIGHFDHAAPAPDALGELIRPVAGAVRHWSGSVPAARIVCVDTDPRRADTAVFVEQFGRELLQRSADCVVVSGETGLEYGGAASCVPGKAFTELPGAVVVGRVARGGLISLLRRSRGAPAAGAGPLLPAPAPDPRAPARP